MQKLNPAEPRLVLNEIDMARVLSVSVPFLQSDRYGARRIPFYKIGRAVRYNQARVFEALAAMEEGGTAKRRGVAA